MKGSQLLEDITTQLAQRGYEIERRLATNQQLQTYTFLTQFTSNEEPEQRVVKVKSMLTLPDGEGSVKKRFEQEKGEIDILKALNHPRIPDVKDYFELTYKDVFDIHILALQYLNMPNLGERIDGKRKLSEMEAITVLTDCLDAFSHAHEKEIYHRDVKPSNILFGRDAAYLIDFNLGKVGSDMGSSFVDNSFGYYPIDAYSADDLNPSFDLVALANTVIAGGFGEEIMRVRHVQGRKDLSVPIDLDNLHFSDRLKFFLRKLGSPKPGLRYQDAKDALGHLKKLHAVSLHELEGRLTEVTRDLRVEALLEEIKKEDGLFEYNVPARNLREMPDGELLAHLEEVYTKDEFRIDHPTTVSRHARKGDKVIKNGTLEEDTIVLASPNDLGHITEVDVSKDYVKITFPGKGKNVIIKKSDVIVVGKSYFDYEIPTSWKKEGKHFPASRLKRSVPRDFKNNYFVGKYLGEDSIYRSKDVIPHGAEGIICGKFETGAYIVWANTPGLNESSEFIDRERKLELLRQFPYDSFMLVRENPINYKQLYEKHFGNGSSAQTSSEVSS